MRERQIHIAAPGSTSRPGSPLRMRSACSHRGMLSRSAFWPSRCTRRSIRRAISRCAAAGSLRW